MESLHYTALIAVLCLATQVCAQGTGLIFNTKEQVEQVMTS